MLVEFKLGYTDGSNGLCFEKRRNSDPAQDHDGGNEKYVGDWAFIGDSEGGSDSNGDGDINVYISA